MTFGTLFPALLNVSLASETTQESPSHFLTLHARWTPMSSLCNSDVSSEVAHNVDIHRISCRLSSTNFDAVNKPHSLTVVLWLTPLTCAMWIRFMGNLKRVLRSSGRACSNMKSLWYCVLPVMGNFLSCKGRRWRIKAVWTVNGSVLLARNLDTLMETLMEHRYFFFSQF